jgi:hypothetical protein
VSALETVRKRYGAAPRELDDDLQRMSRGDRGCLGDGLAAAGAILGLVGFILSQFGIIPYPVAFIGIAVLITGFTIGARAQLASSQQRMVALREGPLVACHVVRHVPYLGERGTRAGRAIVLFTPDPGLAFEGKVLRKTLRRLELALEQPGSLPADEAWVGLCSGKDEFGYAQIPDRFTEGVGVWIADVVVDPARLPGNKLGKEQPALSAIVDTGRAFIEHV